jgi:ATP-dependent DNA helicase RecG
LGSETIQKWINEIKTKTVPIIIPDVELIDIENKTIIALKIQEYPVKPVLSKGNILNESKIRIISFSFQR